MARRRKRRTKRKRSSGGGGKSFQNKAKALMIGGAAYGYLTEHAPQVTAMAAKAPAIINRDITNGLILYFANKHIVKNKHIENVALAALVTGATKFGQAKFALSGEGDIAGLHGFEDATDVGGIIDDYDERD